MQQYRFKVWSNILFICLLISTLSAQDQITKEPILSLDQLYEQSPSIPSQTNILYTHPKENQVVYHKNVQLNWQKTNQTMSHLQVAKDKNFSEIILDTTLTELQYTLPYLEKHRDYYWRVGDPKIKLTTSENGSFFKTSAIMMDEAIISKIDIIPTWVDGQDVLFLYNPLETKYGISVLDDQDNLVTKKSLSIEKYFISTVNWKKGMYKIHLEYSGQTMQTKYFMLK